MPDKVSADLMVSSPAYGGEQKVLGQSGWFALISKIFLQSSSPPCDVAWVWMDTWLLDRQTAERQTRAPILQILGNDEDGSVDQ